MKFTVAFILVVVSMASADIPRRHIEIVKRTAPYIARGWTPTGQQLNLPLKAAPPVPAASYGPPTEEATTTEQPTTTEATTETLIKQKSLNSEVKPEKANLENLEEPQQAQQGQYFVVLPQEQNVVYAIPRNGALFAVPKSNFVAATPARLQVVPFTSASSSAVFTPYSASYIQIYQ